MSQQSTSKIRAIITGATGIVGEGDCLPTEIINSKLNEQVRKINLMKKIIFLSLLVLPSILFAQNTKRDSLWLPLKSFVGNWKGEGGGEPGKGKYERSYQFILNKRFVEIRNKSTYEPTKEYPNGEVHEDIGYLSYDNGRKTFILRQFHIEGFVNQFRLDNISPDKKTLVFITESMENILTGYRAKETYRIINDNEIEETFEIAEPGKDFTVYSKVKLIRQK